MLTLKFLERLNIVVLMVLMVIVMLMVVANLMVVVFVVVEMEMVIVNISPRVDTGVGAPQLADAYIYQGQHQMFYTLPNCSLPLSDSRTPFIFHLGQVFLMSVNADQDKSFL